MYKLIRNEWNLTLHDFSDKLIRALDKSLVMIIGLDEDASVYDSNVLVVVDSLSEEVRKAVASAALEVNEKHECVISYYLTTKDDEHTIRVFLSVEEKKKSDCKQAFEEFYQKIKSIASRVIFTGERYVYDSNVLVVVDSLSEEVRKAVASAALEVNEKHECVISYYLTTKDERLLDEFEKVANSIK